MAQAHERAVEWDKCSADAAYFIHTYCWIKEPQGDGFSVVPFHLWPAQVGVVWKFQLHRLHVILKARQLGISWICCGYALWLCLFRDGRFVLQFSRGQLEADVLLERVTFLYEHLPEWMRVKMPYAGAPNQSAAEWVNGSSVGSLPATQNSGRSFTASLVIMDEAAFMQWGEKLYTALKPTIDGGGQLIVLSTADGARGFFYNLWQKAEKGLNDFVATFLPWWSRPGRTAEWYAKVAAESISSSLMSQEYPSTPDEAFSATDVEKFMPSMLWWDACKIDMPPLDTRTPIVLSADAGINNDSFALTATSRHWVHEDAVAIRYSREWRLSKTRPVDFPEVEAEIKRLCETFDVVEFCYDPYQLHDMATRLQREGVVKTRPFPQGADRLESDKQMLDLVIQRRYYHDGDAALRSHVDHADKKIDTETRKLRIVKRQDDLKIDLLVSAAMGAYRCLKLPL